MLNIEKYKEELENIGVLNPTELAVIDGKPCMCQEAECNMCELRSAEIGCFHKTDNWLFSEYKEPEVDWSKVKVEIMSRETEQILKNQVVIMGMLQDLQDELEPIQNIADTHQLLVDKNNGWIPCNERLPEEGVPVNITYKNSNPPSYYSNIKNNPFTATAISYKNKWYWYSCICLDILNEYGKNEADAVNKDIDIIAWQPLPEPYREEQEDGR